MSMDWKTAHAALSRRAGAQGMVLLKNEENVLPLSAGTHLAIFGLGQIYTVIGGLGSGEVNCDHRVNVIEGARACAEVTLDEDLAELYHTWAMTHPNQCVPKGLGIKACSNPEPPTKALQVSAAAGRADCALVVLSRLTGEGGDIANVPGELRLAEEEKCLLDAVLKFFRKTILVLNVPGYLDLEDYDQKVQAVLFMGYAGQESGHALMDVLTGAVPAQGRLADTWPIHYSDWPCAEHFGLGEANGRFNDHAQAGGTVEQMNVPYEEDIYLGYRYFDTFGLPVRYPFGFGLGYAQTKITPLSVTTAQEEIQVTASVTNLGSVDTREVVQVYCGRPDGTENPPRQLAGWKKTALLSPGGEETVTVTFPASWLARYDEDTACRMLDEGYYDVYVGASSAELTLCASLFNPKTQVTETLSHSLGDLPEDFCRLTGMDAKGIVLPEEEAQRAAARKVPVPMPTVTHICHDGQEPGLPDAIAAEVKGLTDDELCELCCGVGMDMSGFVRAEDDDPEGFGTGDMVKLSVAGAAGATAPLGARKLPQLMLADGPAGLRLTPVKDHPSCTAFPTGSLLASAWDMALLEEIGQAAGEEMVSLGIHGWLAPGMNLHRSPLCGRNFEYFSEDPVHAGLNAAAISRGVDAKGVSVTIKHFACNNQEEHRDCSNSQVSQRALRELYLRSFELAVKLGHPQMIMTSYNDINGVPAANNYDLCTVIARQEWGYDGLIMTDWGGGMSTPAISMLAGNDLIQPGGHADVERLRQALASGEPVVSAGLTPLSGVLTREALERCAGRILRVIYALQASFER